MDIIPRAGVAGQIGQLGLRRGVGQLSRSSEFPGEQDTPYIYIIYRETLLVVYIVSQVPIVNRYLTSQASIQVTLLVKQL